MAENTLHTGRILVLGGPAQGDPLAVQQALAGHYETVVARTMEEALEHLRKQNFDAVLSSAGDFLPLERAVVSNQSAAVLNTLGQGVCIVDVAGRVLWQNRVLASYGAAVLEQACKHSGRALSQFHGVGDLGPAGSPARTRRYAIQVENRFYDLVISPLLDSAEAAQIRQLSIVVWDVTSSRRLQQKLDAIDQAGRELVRLEAEALSKLNVQQRLRLLEERIIRYTRNLLSFDNFGIWLLDRASNKLELVLSDGYASWVGELDLHAATEGNGITGHVAATGRSYICPDTSKDPRYILGIEGARSSLTVPLRLHDTVIGVLNVESPRAGDFSEDDRQFAEIFGGYIAIALNILDLLVVERAASAGRLAVNVAGEIDQPLSDIVSQAAVLIEENVGNDAIRKQLNAIIDSVTSVRQTVRQFAKSPTMMLGRSQIQNVKPESAMVGKRVLVADDDATIRGDLSELLSRYGCVVETARDGAEAMAMVSSRDYDLVVSDIRMPHANGYEIFAAARARSPSRPVILITGFGYDPSHSIFKARQQGVFGVLFKPFKVDQVLELVRQALVPTTSI